jgi:hypothetical protein
MRMARNQNLPKCVLACLLLVVAVLTAQGLDPVLPGRPSVEEIAQRCGIRFPTQSRLLNSYSTFWGQELFAKIQMDTSDVEPFVVGLPDNTTISRTERVDSLHTMDMPWWDPEPAGRYVSINTRPHGNFPSKILIIPKGKCATVYLYHSR